MISYVPLPFATAITPDCRKASAAGIGSISCRRLCFTGARAQPQYVAFARAAVTSSFSCTRTVLASLTALLRVIAPPLPRLADCCYITTKKDWYELSFLTGSDFSL